MRISNFLRYYQNKRHSIHFIKVLLIVELSLQLFSFSSYVYYRVKTLQIATQDIKQNWFFNKTENQWWFPESKLIYSYINPFVGWLTRPMITDHIHIDTNGTRLTTNSSSSKSAKKIFMLGGSTLWGFNVSDQETIPSYVARELNSVSSDFTVMNYSNPGYNSSQEVNYLIKKLKKGNIPNTVIFYDGCNDLQVKTMYTVPQSVYHEQEIIDNIGNIWNFDRPNLDVNRSIFGIEFISNLHQFAFKYIKLYRYPNKIFNKILKRTAQPEQQIYTHQFNPMDAEYISNLVAEEFLTNVALLDKLAQVYKFNYILVWQPLIYNKENKTTEETSVFNKYDKNFGQVYDLALKKIESKQSKYFYNLTTIFNSYTNSFFIDPCHVTGEGNEIIAKKIVELIKSQ